MANVYYCRKMPLYEGIGLISEKHAVVLDIGAAYTKCGYAGELTPRCIVPSLSRDGTALHDLDSEDEIYNELVPFIHTLYFKWLLVNPKDRRVVIIESILGSIKFKVGIERLTLDPSNSRVDLLNRGNLIFGENKETSRPVAHSPEILTNQIVEDILVRCCLVTSIENGKDIYQISQDASSVSSLSTCLNSCPPTVRYPIGGDCMLLIDGVTRAGSAEVLWHLDGEDAIRSCPIDSRRELANNLVLVGGVTMMPGFKSRLNQELMSLLNTPKYKDLKIREFKVHQPPTKPNLATWLGGAIFGATDVVVTRSLPREQYLKDPCVPDWANLRFNSVYMEERQG
ncbi:actin-related protein 10 [Eurytemora carolleeae]|uniref:actin-related protein 10 n=1 Tax=Eurytemora carolleeae TaxID=1294199 RepID=UPI000C7798E5|nr:actin-related protein 10 [Eurytemora carolleeae]|eukprot:XP_023324453.1 actin-related protein 10-like [Eurytemora affinis]